MICVIVSRHTTGIKIRMTLNLSGLVPDHKTVNDSKPAQKTKSLVFATATGTIQIGIRILLNGAANLVYRCEVECGIGVQPTIKPNKMILEDAVTAQEMSVMA